MFSHSGWHRYNEIDSPGVFHHCMYWFLAKNIQVAGNVCPDLPLLFKIYLNCSKFGQLILRKIKLLQGRIWGEGGKGDMPNIVQHDTKTTQSCCALQ